MISVEEARERLLAAASRLPSERVALTEAAARVLAEDVRARRTQPPFPTSMMDGYALRAADADAPLTVVGEAVAGRRYGRRLVPGEAVRIFTGAPVPEGADAVLIQEDARREGERLTANASVRSGENVRRKGLDFAEGELLVPAGTRLGPRHLALVGAGGHADLPVVRRPRVAFLATGNELKPPGAPTGPDDVVASVTPALSAQVEAAGGVAIDLGIAPDERVTIATRAKEGLSRADVLVTLGGASVGEHDLVRPALADLGIALDFWRVAVRPGKPLMFAASPLVLGLPGNPVSGVVCTILFLVPLIEALLGLSPGPAQATAVLGADVPANGPRKDHMRARFDPAGRVVPFPVQDSSMLSVLAAAQCLLIREPHAAAARAGDRCTIVPLA